MQTPPPSSPSVRPSAIPTLPPTITPPTTPTSSATPPPTPPPAFYTGPTSPTITVGDDGYLPGYSNTCNASTLDLTGVNPAKSSIVSATVTTHDTSLASINGNSIVHGYVYAYDHSQIIINNGTVGYIPTNGGGAVYVGTYNNSSVTVNGGTLFGDVVAYAQSSISISDGIVSTDVAANSGGTVNITGGTSFNAGVGS